MKFRVDAHFGSQEKAQSVLKQGYGTPVDSCLMIMRRHADSSPAREEEVAVEARLLIRLVVLVRRLRTLRLGLALLQVLEAAVEGR